MKRILLVLLAFIGLLNHTNAMETIEKGGFEKAKMRAKEEGKLLLLDFYANWCTPCKWMDETTFKDLEVRNLLDQKYIAVKVNIDDFEGFELKSKFDIRFLPSILIFNPNGQMVERVEETLGTSKMREMLRNHADSHSSLVTHKPNTSPREVTRKTSEENNDIVSNQTPNVSQDNISDTQSTYRMQMGVFSTIEGAHQKSQELQATFLEKITIIQQEKDGKILYKVLLGEFNTLSEAKSFKELLNNQFSMASVIF